MENLLRILLFTCFALFARGCGCKDGPACPASVVVYGAVLTWDDHWSCSEIDSEMAFYDVKVIEVIKNESELDIEEDDVVTMRAVEPTSAGICDERSFRVGGKYVIYMDPTGSQQEPPAPTSAPAPAPAPAPVSGKEKSDRPQRPERSRSDRKEADRKREDRDSRRQLRFGAMDCGKVAVLKATECPNSYQMATRNSNPEPQIIEQIRQECLE